MNPRQFHRKLREKRRGTGLGPSVLTSSSGDVPCLLPVQLPPAVVRSAEDLLAMAQDEASDTESNWRSAENLETRDRSFSEAVRIEAGLDRQLEDYKHTISSLRLVS